MPKADWIFQSGDSKIDLSVEASDQSVSIFLASQGCFSQWLGETLSPEVYPVLTSAACMFVP